MRFSRSLQTQEGTRMVASFPRGWGSVQGRVLQTIGESEQWRFLRGSKGRLLAHSRPTSSSIFYFFFCFTFCILLLSQQTENLSPSGSMWWILAALWPKAFIADSISQSVLQSHPRIRHVWQGKTLRSTPNKSE